MKQVPQMHCPLLMVLVKHSRMFLLQGLADFPNSDSKQFQTIFATVVDLQLTICPL